MYLHLQRMAVQPVQGGTSSSRRLLAGGNLPQSLYSQAWPLQSFPAEVHKLSTVSLSLILHNVFHFLRCGQIPEGCKRCDDECAWREGKTGRDDY